jgi:hypothetical protein
MLDKHSLKPPAKGGHIQNFAGNFCCFQALRVWGCSQGRVPYFVPREEMAMRKDSNVTLLRRVAAFLAAAMLASVNPALADDKTIAVSGDSIPSDCGAPKKADSAIEMNGNLTGCLAIFIQHLNLTVS